MRPRLVLLLFLNALRLSNGCTIIAGGKGSTVDGSAFVVHTDDAGGGASDLRMVRVPAADHPKGAMRPVFAFDNGYPRVVTRSRGPYYAPKKGEQLSTPLGHIPQVPHTHGYYDHDYGLVNDVGLAMAESTTSARTAGWSSRFPWGHSMFDIAELSKVGLERCATARCAIQTMGDLAVEHGFCTNYTGTPQHPEYADSAETLAIADKTGEVWIFQIMTGDNNRGAVWAAQRVPDDEITVVPNTLVIREIDFKDKDNFMYSSNVRDVAQRNGWWRPEDGPFDFTRAYIVSDPVPVIPVYVGRRMWRIYGLVAPSIPMDPYLGYMVLPGRKTYPFSVVPDTKVTPSQIMSIMRDYYQGTEFDQTKGLAAQPYGNPVRFSGYSEWNSTEPFPGDWERTVSIYRAVYSILTWIRPDFPAETAAVMWFGLDAPHGTVFVPFYGGQDNVPASYLEGKQSEFSLGSAFWAFNLVNSWSYQMWRLIHAEVVHESHRLQQMSFALHHELDKAALRMAPQKFMKYVEERQGEFAEYVVSEWWAFAFRLIAKYNNGYICTGERVGQQKSWGYTIEYLQYVGYTDWPGAHYVPLDADHTKPLTTLEVGKRRESAAPRAAEASSLQDAAMLLVGAAGAVAYMRWVDGRRGYTELP